MYITSNLTAGKLNALSNLKTTDWMLVHVVYQHKPLSLLPNGEKCLRTKDFCLRTKMTYKILQKIKVLIYSHIVTVMYLSHVCLHKHKHHYAICKSHNDFGAVLCDAIIDVLCDVL